MFTLCLSLHIVIIVFLAFTSYTILHRFMFYVIIIIISISNIIIIINIIHIIIIHSLLLNHFCLVLNSLESNG